ncbi:MAG: hypothetical protein RI989_420 [Bacteroidota bacterium]|jgi:hypothetical protein
MDTQEQILALLKNKSVLKQDVFHNTIAQFNSLKEVLKTTIQELTEKFGNTDSRVTFEYRDRGAFQCEIRVAGDLLIFQMHTNVFQFEKDSSFWQTGYLKEHPENSYVGTINVYNFLSDSFRYDRTADVGYLLARAFINKENHFLVQGKKQLGILFNDLVASNFNASNQKKFVEQIILYALNFDLLIPPYENLHQITVEEMQDINHSGSLATGKRMGFQFSSLK